MEHIWLFCWFECFNEICSKTPTFKSDLQLRGNIHNYNFTCCFTKFPILVLNTSPCLQTPSKPDIFKDKDTRTGKVIVTKIIKDKETTKIFKVVTEIIKDKDTRTV